MKQNDEDQISCQWNLPTCEVKVVTDEVAVFSKLAPQLPQVPQPPDSCNHDNKKHT